jgi:hypothetical protein
MLLAGVLLLIVMLAWGNPGAQIAAGLVAFGLIKLLVDYQDDSSEYLLFTNKRLLLTDRKGKLRKEHTLTGVDLELVSDSQLIIIAREGDLTTRWRCYPRTIEHLKHLEQSWDSMGRTINMRRLTERDPM